MRRRDFAAFRGGLQHSLENFQRRHGETLVSLGAAVRQVAAECFAALVQIAHLRGVIGRLVKRDLGELAVWNRNIETVSKGHDFFVGKFLGLVNRVFPLTNFAHAKTLDGLDQQHCGLTHVIDS